MPDYNFDPSPADVAEAQAYVDSTLDDSAVWRSVSYVPDGRGGSTRTFSDTTIPVWVRNPGSKPSSYSKAPGETTYSWEFVINAHWNLQPKDVLLYNGKTIEITDITQRGTSTFSLLVYGKQVSA